MCRTAITFIVVGHCFLQNALPSRRPDIRVRVCGGLSGKFYFIPESTLIFNRFISLSFGLKLIR